MLAEVMLSLNEPKSHRAKNLTGLIMESGSTVLGYTKSQGNRCYWLVRCYCGIEFETYTKRITSHGKDACENCLRCKRHDKDLSGFKFGNGCVVIKEVERRLRANKTQKSRQYLVECHCGYRWKLTTYKIFTQSSTHECRKCSIKTSIPKRSGKNCGRYNHNLTDEKRQENKDSRGHFPKRFYRICRERDSYRCVVCKSNKETKLHHLDGWHWCKEKRLDIDNIVTVCKYCHDKFHREYGKKWNTKLQFIQFKEINKPIKD